MGPLPLFPPVPDQFTGYAAFSASTWSTLKPHKYTPKPVGPYDIDIRVHFCGVCGSDLHVLRSGWSPTIYPCVAGHEITGTVIRTGLLATILPGTLVGVGAHSWSCGACPACAGTSSTPSHLPPLGEHGYGGPRGLRGGRENYCKDVVETYNWRYPDGSLSYGGYADYVRVHENFVYPIPEGLDEEVVAPMLCGGVTMWSPLRRAGVGVGSRVGIVGLGGLGHFGVMFAKAMGAEVVVISRGRKKGADAKKMGAVFVDSTVEGWGEEYERGLDLVITTSSSGEGGLGEYLRLLKVGGTMVVCGIPEGELPRLSWADLGAANLALRGSNVGSKKEVLEMLDFVKEKGVRSWVQVMPMERVGEVLEMMQRGEARYRFVLKAEGWEEWEGKYAEREGKNAEKEGEGKNADKEGEGKKE